MFNYLRGPNPMSASDISFLSERMAQNGKSPFLGTSYLNGATPQNDYAPSEPYTVTVSENPYSYEVQGVAKLFVKSGGGDSPRAIAMRQAKDGKWYCGNTARCFSTYGSRNPQTHGRPEDLRGYRSHD